MEVDGLVIPGLLLTLLDGGRWPRGRAEAVAQHGRPFVAADRSRRLRRVQLYAPPFRTLTWACEDSFYTRDGALHELRLREAVGIADFGIGEDTPILLDYRGGPTDPRVIRLDWPAGGENRWVEMAPDFAGFVGLLGL